MPIKGNGGEDLPVVQSNSHLPDPQSIQIIQELRSQAPVKIRCLFSVKMWLMLSVWIIYHIVNSLVTIVLKLESDYYDNIEVDLFRIWASLN